MTAITRGRIVAAAGILTLSGLLGTAVAVPGPWQYVETAMSHDGTSGMSHDIRLAMQYEGVPGPWDDGIKLMSCHEGTPQTFQE